MVLAFGDDSVMDDVVACGIALYQQERAPDAERILDATKEKAGVPRSARIHCRVLFSGDARRRSDWAGVSAERVNDFILGLCRALKPVGERPLVAVIDPRNVPIVPASDGCPEIRLTDKGIASTSYQFVLPFLYMRYGHGGFRLSIDSDKTQIPWGAHKHRADSTRGTWVDFAPTMQPLAQPIELQPEIQEPKPALLEVADVYAYVTARAHASHGGRQGRYFEELFTVIHPEVVQTAHRNPNPQWVRAKEANRSG
jgi:hypothetical protein